ncbi:unnamed protein product [Euphydryas editha]|uniref:Fucosyltransferase n=1 Tax=Euphydryas editha TaxID=104508 RepID=A0AAU9TK97_EUPED|nr:unnamed protein product [Euphydryas editha]
MVISQYDEQESFHYNKRHLGKTKTLRENDRSLFLPPGSYLDGRALGPKELARQMSEIIGNKTSYYDFFRWRNYYVYKETSSKEDICKLCEMLNDEEKMSQTSVWNDFRTWWNGARYDYNCN